MMNRIGQRLGNYRLVRLLGRGGFAEVYLGEHVFLRTQAAIKVLQVRLADEEMENFLNEARTVAGLAHPNILRVLEFGVEENIPFLVMEYAANGTLRQRHPRGSILPLTVILPYVRQVATALQYVHSKKLIHRDIKPENLLLGSDNQVLLSDFGTALVVQTVHNPRTLEMAGTVTYMAPEQIRGKPRPASDLYGLAVVVYEWLCGVCPFQGSFTELYNQHMFVEPPSLRERNPAISPEVEQVMMMALAKDPERRFASVAAFAHALEQASMPFVSAAPAASSSPLPSPLLSSNSFSTLEDGPTLAATVKDPSPPSLPYQHTPAPAYSPLPSQPVAAYPPTTPQPVAAYPAAPQPVVIPGVGPSTQKPQPEPEQERRISRRAVVLGLGLTGVALAGGAATLLVLTKRGPAGANPSTLTPTPAPGTTFVTYRGHTNQVYALAWTPRGQHIGSGGKDNKVRIWDPTAPAGTDIYVFLQHSGSVNAVVWSPDGMRIASGSADTTVRVWDATTGGNVISYRGHTDNVRAVAWSPDGRLIASAGDDKTVQVWEAATGTLLFTYKNHTGLVWSVSWSPDSTRIASASTDKTVRVWNATNGDTFLIYRGHAKANAIKTVAWSPDGKRIASGGDDNTVQVWEVATGNSLVVYAEHSGGVYALAWSPDMKHIASSSWAEVRIWNPIPLGGETLNTYSSQTGAVHALAWSPDGQHVASGADDATVQIWQAV